jgi:hypothetical protein
MEPYNTAENKVFKSGVDLERDVIQVCGAMQAKYILLYLGTIHIVY